MTFFELIFVEIGGKVERYFLVWGIYAMFAINIFGSSKLIISLILSSLFCILAGLSFSSLKMRKKKCWDRSDFSTKKLTH